jgi:hypothetical protein
MALLAVIALNAIGLGFAHDQFLGREHGGIRLPVIGAIEGDLPLGQAIDHPL